MGWQALLEAMDGLQGIGMGIPAALEQHARSGEGVSRDLAEEWQLHRWRLGDPAAAMRALAPNARGPYDRFVLEVLVLCLERPSADHRRMLTVALARLRAARFEGDRPRGAAAVLRLALVLVALTAGEDLGNATELRSPRSGAVVSGGCARPSSEPSAAPRRPRGPSRMCCALSDSTIGAVRGSHSRGRPDWLWRSH